MNQRYLDAMFSRDDLPFLEQVVDIKEPAVGMDKGAVAEVQTEVADGEEPQIGTPGWGEPGLLSPEEGMGKPCKVSVGAGGTETEATHDVAPAFGS